MQFRPRRLAAAVAAGMMVLAATLVSSPAHAAGEALGIRFLPDWDAGQCNGPQEQWVPVGTWSTTIRINTDNRRGGCQFALGLENAGSGTGLTYNWIDAGGGSQCGSPGLYTAPTTIPRSFGPSIRMDTDDRGGGCRLTLAITSLFLVVDVSYQPESGSSFHRQQCGSSLGVNVTVTPSTPVTLTVDTDSRPGGCNLQLRLRSAF